jgi:prepilin-type N-terminal cleavage/methylation domain-containing protein
MGERGLTLLEMVVVLVLLGVVLALSVPPLVPPRTGSDDPVQGVLDTARRAAVRRAESLSLAIDADGRWVIASADPSAPETVRSGRLDRSPGAALRATVSPLGACWIDAGADASPRLDPVRCRLAEGSRS